MNTDPSGSFCNATSGLVLDRHGELFVGSGWGVFRLRPDLSGQDPQPATLFVGGIRTPNGLAFDRNGNLWISDGQGDSTFLAGGRGKVWRVTPGGAISEPFRIQPMRNGRITNNPASLVTSDGYSPPDNGPLTPVTHPSDALADGIGRQVRSFPPGLLTNTATTIGDRIVANGIAFDHEGNLFVADTARGAIWRVELAADGTVKSPMGCDTTFTRNTLCMRNVYAAHPLLESADGIALDSAGNIYVDSNGRQSIVVVTREAVVVNKHGYIGARRAGSVEEVFRNPVNRTTGLRNAHEDPTQNNRILELPSSPHITGKTFCTANIDMANRDNLPSSGGETDATNVTSTYKSKISCIDQDLMFAGLPLPVR